MIGPQLDLEDGLSVRIEDNLSRKEKYCVNSPMNYYFKPSTIFFTYPVSSYEFR